jgi:hypothetical protein
MFLGLMLLKPVEFRIFSQVSNLFSELKTKLEKIVSELEDFHFVEKILFLNPISLLSTLLPSSKITLLTINLNNSFSFSNQLLSE